MFSLRSAIRAIRGGLRPNNDEQERKNGDGDRADFCPINIHRVAEFFADVISMWRRPISHDITINVI